MNYFIPGDWTRALSAWAIWCVALIVSRKQPLSSSFLSLWWTRQQLRSAVGLFHTSHSQFFGAFTTQLFGGRVIVRFNQLQPFPSVKAQVVHLVECRWTHPVRGNNMNTDPRPTHIFLPNNDSAGKWGSKLRIWARGRWTEKVCNKLHGQWYMKWTEVPGSCRESGKPRHTRGFSEVESRGWHCSTLQIVLLTPNKEEI